MTSARADGATERVPVVHAVTNDEILSRSDFFDVACNVMRELGPRGAVHLRTSVLTGARLQLLAEGLSAAQGITGAWLIVNDRVDVAMAAHARGAQLTSGSLTVFEARRVAPLLALGASVHDERQGLAAAASGADWLVARRSVLDIETSDRNGGLRWMEALASKTSSPVLAIGGMRPDRLAAVRAAGLRGVAVISGIWNAPNAVRAAREYLSAYDDAGVA